MKNQFGNVRFDFNIHRINLTLITTVCDNSIMTEQNSSNNKLFKIVKNNRSRIFGLLFFIFIFFFLVFLSKPSSEIPEPAQENKQLNLQNEFNVQENKIDIGKTIQKTVQSDPCIEDIVKGLPQENWRCITPEPSENQSDFLYDDNKEIEEEGITPSPTFSPEIIENTPELEQKPSIETINWDDAFNYVGELVIICGPVIDSHFAASSSGQPTFLNIGREYPDPDRFTVLIWGSNLEAFPFDPDVYYIGKTVCIRGVIEEYEGIFEIEVRRPEQIEIR